MSDLISKEETISYIENWKEVNKYYHPYTKNTNIPIDEVIQVIKDVPSNNQKTGHWKLDVQSPVGGMYKCSECGRLLYLFSEDNILEKYPYCHCGAKMEGE